MILILSYSEISIIQQQQRAPKSILIPTSIKSFRRRSQFDNSLPVPPPCSHLPSQSSLPPPKSFKIPAIESFDSLQKNTDLSEIDSTTSSLLYPRLSPSNSASKYTTSSLDILLETTSESTIRQPPRHRYNLRNNRRPILLSQVQTLLFYDITLNLFQQTLFRFLITLQLLKSVLLSLNAHLFQLTTKLVISFLGQFLNILVFFHLIVICLKLT